MDRWAYFARRLLLLIPTFIGITFACFAFCQAVPGGPVEQAIMRMRGVGEAQTRFAHAGAGVSEAQRRALEAHFGFDRPWPQRYWKWLVHDRMGLRVRSYMYPNKTVWELIAQRFPVSLVFGLTGFLLTYLVCVPLGILKALRHGGWLDLTSSALVFIGYAIPAFAFGMLLKTLFTGASDRFWAWFPATGFVSPEHASLGAWGRALDIAAHMFLPVLCYIIGGFAVLTVLMKNSLLEQLSQDYVRAVLARGATWRRAVWRHALRNALVPIATGFGGILSVMFAGSVLIEKVFEIPGMGLLSLDAVVGRDYMVFMGIVAVTSIAGLLGRVLSDLCYVLIDPRIDFRS